MKIEQVLILQKKATNGVHGFFLGKGWLVIRCLIRFLKMPGHPLIHLLQGPEV
jgi:hypothetical protein